MAKFKQFKQINSNNLDYTYMELDFTHDFKKAKIGSVFINRDGESKLITKINIDSGGRKCYYNGNICLATQYSGPHNMLSKSPFWAYRWRLKQNII